MAQYVAAWQHFWQQPVLPAAFDSVADWHRWWAQPMLAAGSRAIGPVTTAALRGRGPLQWLKPALLAVAAFARAVHRNGAVATVTRAAPPHWRLIWVVMTSLMGIIAPPAFHAVVSHANAEPDLVPGANMTMLEAPVFDGLSANTRSKLAVALSAPVPSSLHTLVKSAEVLLPAFVALLLMVAGAMRVVRQQLEKSTRTEPAEAEPRDKDKPKFATPVTDKGQKMRELNDAISPRQLRFGDHARCAPRPRMRQLLIRAT